MSDLYRYVPEEEQEAERYALLTGGLRGFALGGLISGCVFALSPRYYPSLLKMSNSIKTAVLIIPPFFCGTVNAQHSSHHFKESITESEFVKNRLLKEHQNWIGLSTQQKIFSEFELHKYQIITGLWAGSMYGSWWFVNRDKLLTKSQKFVQARMYAQFLTVGLLLATMGLTMYEQSHHLIKDEESQEDEYLRLVIEDGEADEKSHKK